MQKLVHSICVLDIINGTEERCGVGLKFIDGYPFYERVNGDVQKGADILARASTIFGKPHPGRRHDTTAGTCERYCKQDHNCKCGYRHPTITE